jgi:hypothetical protein
MFVVQRRCEPEYSESSAWLDAMAVFDPSRFQQTVHALDLANFFETHSAFAAGGFRGHVPVRYKRHLYAQLGV